MQELGTKQHIQKLYHLQTTLYDTLKIAAGEMHIAANSNIPFFAAMSRFPISSVTYADPFKTISTMVRNALTDSRSVGQMKLPAALLITMSGSPRH